MKDDSLINIIKHDQKPYILLLIELAESARLFLHKPLLNYRQYLANRRISIPSSHLSSRPNITTLQTLPILLLYRLFIPSLLRQPRLLRPLNRNR